MGLEKIINNIVSWHLGNKKKKGERIKKKEKEKREIILIVEEIIEFIRSYKDDFRKFVLSSWACGFKMHNTKIIINPYGNNKEIRINSTSFFIPRKLMRKIKEEINAAIEKAEKTDKEELIKSITNNN
ncbi:hypothetical protein KKA23_01510 [Patescibacteria group bacterium]|nr:hypothetical protein [Patescibacteria group bacterium]